MEILASDNIDAYIPPNSKERIELIQLVEDYRNELERLLPLAENELAAVALIGSTLTLTYLHYQTTDTFQIVFPEEDNLGDGRISFLSPAGRRLLFAKQGDIIVIPMPSGSIEVRVETIQIALPISGKAEAQIG
nr:GreA/GreB family elongation factor [Paenibacillus roseus]